MTDDVPTMTLAQWAHANGRITTADVASHIHAGLRSMPTTKTYARWNARELARLQAARDATHTDYRAAIDAGLVRPPSELSAMDKWRRIAAGCPDNESVQAARRILAKRGEPWPA